MRAIFFAFALFAASAAPSLADAPSLAAQDGAWVCLPDDDTAPQVYVDFEENVYRRCDQNICSLYDIASVRRSSGKTEIAFAPGAVMSADDDGSRYTESLVFGATTVTSTGRCSFRSGDG